MTNAAFYWTPELQIFELGGRQFVHEGATPTAPSHDVAHLVCGAAGLPWDPGAVDATGVLDVPAVKMSEFCAVLLERLARAALEDRPVEEALRLARWFVETHYAPFPMPLEQAIRRFAGADLAELLRLSPWVLAQRALELAEGEAVPSGAMLDTKKTPSVDGLEPAIARLGRALLGVQELAGAA